jgi:hypothetical protein
VLGIAGVDQHHREAALLQHRRSAVKVVWSHSASLTAAA